MDSFFHLCNWNSLVSSSFDFRCLVHCEGKQIFDKNFRPWCFDLDLEYAKTLSMATKVVQAFCHLEQNCGSFLTEFCLESSKKFDLMQFRGFQPPDFDGARAAENNLLIVSHKLLWLFEILLRCGKSQCWYNFAFSEIVWHLTWIFTGFYFCFCLTQKSISDFNYNYFWITSPGQNFRKFFAPMSEPASFPLAKTFTKRKIADWEESLMEEIRSVAVEKSCFNKKINNNRTLWPNLLSGRKPVGVIREKWVWNSKSQN